MTDELQAGIVLSEPEVEVDEVIEEQEQQTPDGEGSELATDTGDNQEKITFTEAQQRVFNDAIAKKTAKLRDIERELEAERQRRSEIEARLPKETRPDVPPIPDPYDDDYEEKVRQRDEAIARRVAFDAEQQLMQRRQQELEQQKAYEQQQVLEQKVSSYSERAKKFGIKPEVLQAAGSTVASYGISNDLADFILSDSDGPLITTHLASNPIELDNLRSMSVGSAAVHIATVIKPKLAALKPKPSGAPDPAPVLKGNGVAPKERGPKGATFV